MTERFIVSNFGSIVDLDRSECLQTIDVRAYVQFSMKDVIYLTKLNTFQVILILQNLFGD